MLFSIFTEFTVERGEFIDINVREHEGLREHVFWRVLVFLYEYYFDDHLFHLHMHLMKNSLVQLVITGNFMIIGKLPSDKDNWDTYHSLT